MQRLCLHSEQETTLGLTVRACGRGAPLCSSSMAAAGTPRRAFRYLRSMETGMALGTRRYGCSRINFLALGSLLCRVQEGMSC